MGDILFQQDEYKFSYRVAGLLIHDGHILLQKPFNDTIYAVPGGHVAFGETNAETLIREFKEEMGADITVGNLKWVAEIFFPWEDKTCHQICLYYEVLLEKKEQIPLSGMFTGNEELDDKKMQIQFHWIPIDQTGRITVYPENIPELLRHFHEGVKHFVYKEQ